MYNFDQPLARDAYDAIRTIPRKPQHEDCIPLWIADMDFAVAEPIQRALQARMSFPNFGYTQRTPRYYSAVADWMERRHSWSVRPEWIATTPGIIPAMAYAIRALVEPHGKVLIQPPLYPPFASMIEKNGRQAVASPLIRREGRYEIDFEDFEKKASDPAVGLFFLCNPHNPVARVWENWELERLAEICLRHGVIIFSDDVHQDIVFDGFTYTPISSLSDEVAHQTLTATAPVKTFNIAGFKVANTIIPDNGLRSRFENAVESHWDQHLGIGAIEATIAAYDEGEPWLEETLTYLQENSEFIDSFLAGRLPEVTSAPQEGTYLKWLDFSSLGFAPQQLEDFMLTQARVWMNEGFTFGKEGDGFERLNFASPRSLLAEALERIASAVAREVQT